MLKLKDILRKLGRTYEGWGQWDVYLVAADWCEEYGNPLHAETLRWLVKVKRRPDRALPSCRKIIRRQRCPTWFKPGTLGGSYELPAVIWREMDGGDLDKSKRWRDYNNIVDAIMDVLQAWTKLSPKEREELLK